MGMCLLAVLFRAHPDAPLIVAANRDELLARPATPMTWLEESPPRIAGGKDLLAGGTWMAISESGLFAGLTNRPATGGRDPAKRSRGEIPLALARAAGAGGAMRLFDERFAPHASAFNPAWLLAGDREALHYIDLADEARHRALAPGLHVLENRALEAPSPKADHVRAMLAGVESLRGDTLTARLAAMLADHTIPEGARAAREAKALERPLETEANCVHAGIYGTRSAAILVVPAQGPPRIRYTKGPPCTTAWEDWPF
jgi:uncharacterized protein with NRDE domain